MSYPINNPLITWSSFITWGKSLWLSNFPLQGESSICLISSVKIYSSHFSWQMCTWCPWKAYWCIIWCMNKVRLSERWPSDQLNGNGPQKTHQASLYRLNKIPQKVEVLIFQQPWTLVQRRSGLVFYTGCGIGSPPVAGSSKTHNVLLIFYPQLLDLKSDFTSDGDLHVQPVDNLATTGNRLTLKSNSKLFERHFCWVSCPLLQCRSELDTSHLCQLAVPGDVQSGTSGVPRDILSGLCCDKSLKNIKVLQTNVGKIFLINVTHIWTRVLISIKATCTAHMTCEQEATVQTFATR